MARWLSVATVSNGPTPRHSDMDLSFPIPAIREVLQSAIEPDSQNIRQSVSFCLVEQSGKHILVLTYQRDKDASRSDQIESDLDFAVPSYLKPSLN